MKDSYLMAPLPNIVSNTSSSNATAASNGTQQDLFTLFSAFGVQYGDFANFSSTNLQTKNPISAFFPSHCLGSSQYKEMPIIGYSGTPKYMDPLIKDMTKLCKLHKNKTAFVVLFQ